MIGNVWEWTSTLWGQDWQQSDYAYPYRPDDGRENGSAAGTVYRLFRGGAFDDELTQLRCAARRWYAPDHAGKTRGFRVALSLEGSI
jgi:iron(II)-dependent oxidoreductase